MYNSLVMVMLHSAGVVQVVERSVELLLVLIVRASVVHVMSEGSDHQSQLLEICEIRRHPTGLKERENRVRNMERMPPIVIQHRSIVFPQSQKEFYQASVVNTKLLDEC